MKKYAVLTVVLVLMVALVAGCGGGAAEGDTVTVNYTGTLDDGTVFDSTVGGDPLTFVIGDGTMIEGFDKAVRGMKVGEIKTVTIPADEAYGEYYEDLVIVLDREELPDDIVVGQQLMLRSAEAEVWHYFTVIDISDTEVTLDGNVKLAGEDLTFEIELVSIEKASD
jgi:peptidylprolyl isomerase